MSRTYRKDHYVECNKISFGKPWHIKGDKKRWYKPNKIFKKTRKQRRKAQEKQALRLEKEIIPEFPKDDVWDWN